MIISLKNSLNDLIQILPGFKRLKIIDISDSITEEKLGNKLGLDLFKALSSIENLEEIYCNYNEITDKNTQKEIFELLKKCESLKIVQLKGNEINKNLVKKFEKDLTIDKLVCFSDNEEESEEEEKEEKKIDDLTKDIENIDINQ